MDATTPRPTTITSVLVPVDPEDGGGRPAVAALGVASDLAERSGAAITLVAVDPQAVPLVDPLGCLTALATGPAGGPAVDTRVDVTTRSVASHLAQAPVEGEVVCMATHGRGRLGALVLGSVADAVIRRTSAPVLLVGPRHRQGDLGRPVLAGLDGGDRDAGVVRTAVAWAQALGTEVVLTTVVTSPSDPVAWEIADEVLVAGAAVAEGLGVQVTTDPVAAGDPVAGLLAASEDAGAGCVVLGSRRRSAVQALSGSTVHDLARRAETPVLVAP